MHHGPDNLWARVLEKSKKHVTSSLAAPGKRYSIEKPTFRAKVGRRILLRDVMSGRSGERDFEAQKNLTRPRTVHECPERLGGTRITSMKYYLVAGTDFGAGLLHP
jgi:hypothetical protein